MPDPATELLRQRSRRLLDQLSVGERFMLMFGRGVLKHNPVRVVPITSKPTPDSTPSLS